MIRYIDEVSDLKGKYVLLRLDLNVPVEGSEVREAYRIERAIDTIDFLRAAGARTIIISHTEANADGKKEGVVPTLLPMWKYLNGYVPVDFCPTFFTPEAIDKVLKMEDKGVLLFENVRMNPGEKANDPAFAAQLAQMAELYVNDAFAVSHRAHASIVGVPKLLPHYGGLLMRQEITQLSKAFNPKRPFLFIIGGAKFDTKLPLIKKYLNHADSVFVGGALANNVFKEMGYEIGTSLASEGNFGIKEMLATGKLRAPIDVTVSKPDGSVRFAAANDVQPDEYILDVGPQTIDEIKKIADGAQTIVWNGPLGHYEKGGKDKTEQLAEIIAAATAGGAESVVGGGDTLAAIASLGLQDKFTFISTGGGAMLDFLATETLPGIDALTE